MAKGKLTKADIKSIWSSTSFVKKKKKGDHFFNSTEFTAHAEKQNKVSVRVVLHLPKKVKAKSSSANKRKQIA